jgi:DNA-binding Lrp family transcriptional regulator
MSNLNLKGIWIPIEILTDDKLSDKEKIIYAIILYLSKENNYCYCTNKTISELLNISVTQVSNLISSLKTKKYIDTKMIYKENTKQVEMRKLIPIQNNDTYLRKVKYPPQENFNPPIKENFKDNKYNNKINNKYNGDNKICKKNMANFEQRDYSDFNWNSLYANADISV